MPFTSSMNCTALSSRTTFESYIALLQNDTDSDFSLVTTCRAEVCGALWGAGNPDVSGIGMAIGYILESSICLVTVLALFWIERWPPKKPKLAKMLLSNASRAFYDTAVFFTFAIQAASIATLTIVDFGVSADGMGALTMQITWLVSILTLLPLLPLILQPRIFSDDLGNNTREAFPARQDRSKSAISLPSEHASSLQSARQELRFLSFVICWGMAFCPFFSRMGATFGQSKIGDDKDSAIFSNDWKHIEDACFQDIPRTSPTVQRFVAACGIMSYLLVSIVVVGKILASILAGCEWKWLAWLRRTCTELADRCPWWTSRLNHIMCVAVFALLAVHFWALFRVRRVQKDMNDIAGGDFPDGRWTFGQIVAVTVFVPVFVEAVFSCRKRSLLLS